CNRDIDTAIEIWTGEARRDDDHSRSTHNLAVMFHTLALDIEFARQTETISKQLEAIQYRYWHKGLMHWSSVLADESFWNELSTRIHELNDPRIPTTSASQIRSLLPLVLLVICAQIVARAATSGAKAEALKYRSLIQELGFAEKLVDEALERAA